MDSAEAQEIVNRKLTSFLRMLSEEKKPSIKSMTSSEAKEIIDQSFLRFLQKQSEQSVSTTTMESAEADEILNQSLLRFLQKQPINCLSISSMESAEAQEIINQAWTLFSNHTTNTVQIVNSMQQNCVLITSNQLSLEQRISIEFRNEMITDAFRFYHYLFTKVKYLM